MNTSLIRTALLRTALIAGSAAISVTSMAQENAIRTMQSSSQETTAATSATANDHPQADRLAAALDAYNNQGRQRSLAERERASANESFAYNPTAERLASQLNDHDNATKAELARTQKTPENQSAASADRHATASELARELTRYNETGGRTTL